MKGWFCKLRYRLAYWIASDWIDRLECEIGDLEYRLSGLLCEVTGCRLSKTNYNLRFMLDEVHENRMRECDECECFKRAQEQEGE